MKVAYFIGGLNRGGTETLVLDSFRKNRSAPFESILVYRNDGELSESYCATGVPMFRIKPKGLKLAYIPQIRKLLRQERVDVLHTQTLLNALLGVFCVCFSPVKLVASFHGFRYSFLERVYTHIVMWYASASVFVSGYVRDWYIKHTLFAPRKRCHIVYNGIDFSRLDKAYPMPEFLREINNNERKTNLVMVGNFVSGRSQLFLCQVANALVENGVSEFRLFFVGKRSDAEPKRYDTCVKYCCDHDLLNKAVFFLGGRNDVPAILQYMDAFVYASDHDTFGIAVAEAMAAGLPVVLNDWEVMKEITGNGTFAMLYRTRDVDDCFERIKDLLSHVEEYKRNSKEMACRVRELYSIETHIQKLNKIYEVVVKHKSNKP